MLLCQADCGVIGYSMTISVTPEQQAWLTALAFILIVARHTRYRPEHPHRRRFALHRHLPAQRGRWHRDGAAHRAWPPPDYRRTARRVAPMKRPAALLRQAPFPWRLSPFPVAPWKHHWRHFVTIDSPASARLTSDSRTTWFKDQTVCGTNPAQRSIRQSSHRVWPTAHHRKFSSVQPSALRAESRAGPASPVDMRRRQPRPRTKG